MKVQCVQGSMPTKLRNTISKSARRTSKEAARERDTLLEVARIKNEKPQPYHIMPELNIFGLPIWM